jgi:hypothetical protein
VGAHQHLPAYAPSRLTRLIPNHAVRIGRAGYVGYPAQASREFGKAAVEAFVEVAYEKMIEALENPKPERRSALGRVPVLRTGFRRGAGLAVALAGAVGLGYLLARGRRS